MNSYKAIGITDHRPTQKHELAVSTGTVYSVCEEKDGMLLATNQNGEAGWIRKDFLQQIPEGNTPVHEPCALCRQSVSDSYVTAKEKFYHPDCFKCGVCGNKLAGKSFIEKENIPYCENCFHKGFSPRCAHCNEILSGSYITAMDKNWHPNHFVCKLCGKENQDSFRRYKDNPYCESCFLKNFLFQCNLCGLLFEETDKMIQVEEQNFHEKCFLCSYDGHLMPKEEKVFSKDKKLYCQAHYKQFIKKRCAVCGEDFKGKYLTALEKDFHEECLECQVCKCKLKNKKIFERDGIFVCSEHQISERKKKEIEAEEKKRRKSLQRVYEYKDLKRGGEMFEKINPARRAEFLSPEEFEKLFGMSFKEFKELELWKQRQILRRRDLL